MPKRTDAPQIPFNQGELDAFCALVWERGRDLYRDLPWRNTFDPYEVLVSEVMLQQTQVARVQKRWFDWLDVFPTVTSLAEAPLAPVLEAWQGLGYNRRAIALKKAAEQCVRDHGGTIPCDRKELLALPGIGPSTAAGVRVYAYSQPDIYLETNVRTVFIHELFSESEGIADREIVPLVEATCDFDDPRGWYYALLDYGAYLKKTIPNPSRRSAHHTTQSKFIGSRRQKRAWLLREVLANNGADTRYFAVNLSTAEEKAGRPALEVEEVAGILDDLAGEGFIIGEDGHWFVS